MKAGKEKLLGNKAPSLMDYDNPITPGHGDAPAVQNLPSEQFSQGLPCLSP